VKFTIYFFPSLFPSFLSPTKHQTIRAKAELLASLGAQNDARDLPLLLSACRETETPEGAASNPNLLETNIVRSGRYRDMGEGGREGGRGLRAVGDQTNSHTFFPSLIPFPSSGALRGLSYLHAAADSTSTSSSSSTVTAYSYLHSRLINGGHKETQLPVRVEAVEAFARAASYVQDKSTRQQAARLLAELLMEVNVRVAETAAWALPDFLPQEAGYYSR